MIRKLNFTGRKKLPGNRVTVTLLNLDQHPYTFEAQIDMSGTRLPNDASIFLEAYKRPSYMRFSFGTVGQIKIPENRELSKIAPGVIPLYRMKVVQKGRIIALADKIFPKGADQNMPGKVSLLHVEFSEELGDQIWKLDLEGDWPTLRLNNRIDSIKEIARSDIAFSALVYPEVLRQVLHHIFSDESFDPELDEDDWPALWIRFIAKLPGVGSPPSGRRATLVIEQSEWMNGAVEAFCKYRNQLNLYKEFIDKE